VEAARELGTVLVPALCQRLRAATVELASFEQRLGRSGRAGLGDERVARRHEALSGELRRLGFCLGVLGAGGRADLLRGRHVPEGLAWMAEELARALALSLSPSAEALPRLRAGGSGSWSPALLLAWGFLRAARAGAPELAWRVERDALHVALPGLSAELARDARRLGRASACALRTTRHALLVPLS
jgi:hypothetical protein